MNEGALRPGNVAAAAVLIGGVLATVLPQHAMSIVQLVIVTVAVSTGLYALAVHVPSAGWISPFKWMSPFGRAAYPGRRRRRSDELRSIRLKLSGRRQPIENGPPMPPVTLRLLKPLIASALDLDPSEEPPPPSARGRVSPLTWAVLTSQPLRRPRWFRTLRPNEREVTQTVHSVLDELDRLKAGASDPKGSINSSQARVP